MSQVSSTRGTDHGSLPNVLFPSSGSFRYASAGSENEAASGLGGAASNIDAGGDPNAPSLVIWGTDVSVNACKRQFIEFIKESRFTIEEADMDEARFEWQKLNEPRPLYLTKLEEILHVPNEPYLTINCAHLKEYNENLYRQLVHYPAEVIQIFDMGANEVFQDLYPEQHDQIIISVRPFNIDQTYTIRGLNPQDIGKLVTISGMVTRVSTIIPEMMKAFFRCTQCYFTREVAVENGRIAEPHVCTACNSKFCFQIIHSRCRFIDRQLIKLQESPDDMPAGQTPSTVSLVACADLVDKVSPGDRIYVTGVYRATAVRVMPRQRRVRATYRTTIDVIHYRKIKSDRLHDESSALRLNADRVDLLKALAKDENIYDKIANSLCPSIFGHLDVKKGVLLQLFGGTKKQAPGKYSDPKLRHFRSEINVLLCGDPGTSKSQILQYVYKLVPRGQYTSGKGSSAVGLTAYVTRDLDTRQLVLQTGALVMCDGGICCIDEFDKMSDSTRSVLHEVMEQQTLSIAKAGIVCQLNARTSILAAANPVESEWDKNKTVLENIRMPDTLLSRFDLIFLLLDPNNDEYDKQLARHLVSLYHSDHVHDSNLLSHDLLKDYIAYARANIKPAVTDESARLLIEKYLELRERASKKGYVSVYPRNFESLIRISEAHAKMRLSNTVDVDDVLEALRLTEEALVHSRTDPSTGKISDDMI